MKIRPPFPKAGPCLTDEEAADYLSHQGDRDRIEAHLAGCADCLDLVLGARALLKSESSRVSRSLRRHVRPRTNPLLSLGAAAAVLTITLVAAWALTRRSAAPVAPPAPVTQRADSKKSEETIPVREEKKEPVRTEKREERSTERTTEPVREKKSERGIADRIPGPRRDEPTAVRKEAFTVKAVTGRVRYGDRELRAGDPLELSIPLRTPYGEHARVEVEGASLLLHHETSFALGPGALRISSGRLFVRSSGTLRAETPAGIALPEGTEFAMEVSAASASIIVRSGNVRFANLRGEAKIERGQLLRCAPGQAPGRPVRVDLPSALRWVETLERSARSPDEAWLLLYPASKKSAIVVTAPHMPIETQTSRFAARLAERLSAPLVVANGYKRPRKIEVNVPGEEPAQREAFDEYRRLVREGSAASPVGLLVEIHGYGSEGESNVIEISTSGISKTQLEKLKDLYAQILKKHAPEVEATLVFDLTDPKRIKFPAGPMKTRGIFRPETTVRGWKVELPWAVRWKEHEKYAAILAELVESLR